MTMAELGELRARLKKSSSENKSSGKIEITVGLGTCGIAAGANETLAAFERAIQQNGLASKVALRTANCMGYCSMEPTVSFESSSIPYTVYGNVTEKVVDDIVKAIAGDQKFGNIDNISEIDFSKKQRRIVLQNCGIINPENIEEYIARDGYLALEKALFELTSEQIVDEVKASGLRGRGGAGFPTGVKWESGLRAKGDVKYVVCNADEGDPGAYMDRSLIEGDPNSIIEAMEICGKAIGSHNGFIYIRAEYPLAVHRLEVAIEQAKKYGLLGKNILGSGFDFDLEIRLGAGAFVCGEETALLRSIEGKRGMPTPKPPFPAQSGLWGKPTIINNVETLGNIPVILRNGSGWFSKIGDADSKGTKVFALTGKINNSGLVEVPMGTTLREIIFDIGGGIKGGKKFKGVQTGGPSGGILSEAELDTPIDFGALQRMGSMMGSGGMIVMDEDNCVVDISKFYMEFCVDESCGKCSPCRIGTRQMHTILDKISNGNATMEDLDKLEDIGSTMKACSLCALGQTAPNPTLSTLKKFRGEYEAHIKDHKCVAGKCKNLFEFFITEKCIGCTACARNCPVSCISGEVKARHEIDQSKCIKCGGCEAACKFDSIIRR